jgi:hypothetical protein
VLSRTAEIDNLFYAGQCMLGSFIVMFPEKSGYLHFFLHSKFLTIGSNIKQTINKQVYKYINNYICMVHWYTFGLRFSLQ